MEAVGEAPRQHKAAYREDASRPIEEDGAANTRSRMPYNIHEKAFFRL